MTNYSKVLHKVMNDYAKSSTGFRDWEAWKEHATSDEDNHAFNHLFHVMESLMIECCKAGQESEAL
jgi:predicted alpha/beta hydrolase